MGMCEVLARSLRFVGVFFVAVGFKSQKANKKQLWMLSRVPGEHTGNEAAPSEMLPCHLENSWQSFFKLDLLFFACSDLKIG